MFLLAVPGARQSPPFSSASFPVESNYYHEMGLGQSTGLETKRSEKKELKKNNSWRNGKA